jgi:two-component sensor histidine kinase
VKGEEARVRIEGPAVMLEPSSVQTTAIALHELATNAAKYGALSTSAGRVDISRSLPVDGRLSLRWIESGGPTAVPPTRRGFGTRVMENMIGQLKGKMRFCLARRRAHMRNRRAARIGRGNEI